MLKQPMPGMTDTLEFVKNLWGGMNIPGAMPGMSALPGMPVMPGAGMSVEDLDKKIADLKAVESWLNLNMGMLRGSIQALEIQRGTLATLKSMGDSMAQAMTQTGAASESAMAPFAQFFAQAAQAAVPAATAKQAAPPTPAPAPQPTTPPEPAAAQQTGADAMPAAVAWWNLLQEQFRQAVASAIPPEGAAKADKPEEPAPDSAAPDAGAASAPGKPARRPTRSKTDKA